MYFANALFRSGANLPEDCRKQIHESLLPKDMKDTLIQLIETRAARLT